MNRPSALRPAALLLGAMLLPFGMSQAKAAPVAFVEAAKGVGDLAAVIQVRRGNKPVAVKGRYFNLDAGDEITLRDPKAQVAVRYLGNNAIHQVRRSPGGAGPDYRVRTLEMPGLTQAVFAWLAGQIVGKGDGRPVQEITASSRSIRGSGGRCDATVAGEPAVMQFRGAGSAPSRVVADGRPLTLAWIGGTGPYSLELAGSAETVKTGGCFARIDGAALTPGVPTTLTLRDGSAAGSAKLALDVVKSRPAVPPMLAAAKLAEPARQLYYASWLSGLDGGIWAIEAQRVALAQDCALPEVKAWLDNAGLRAACD